MGVTLAFEKGFPKERRIHFRCHQYCTWSSEPVIELFCPGSKENARRRSHHSFDSELKRPFRKIRWTKDWFPRLRRFRRHNFLPWISNSSKELGRSRKIFSPFQILPRYVKSILQ